MRRTAVPQLIQISAFWRNDKEDGIGVTLTQDLGDLDQVVAILKVSYDAMWRDAVYQSTTVPLVDDLVSQLRTIGRSKPHVKLETSFLVIGNVYLLEKTGFLKPDEFNGLQLLYARGPVMW
jgi:hypothetical protein